MPAHITSAEINLLSGIFTATIDFQPGLNIISGENGTGKTQLLRGIKASQVKVQIAEGQPRILAFSPKRNSERKNIDRLIQEMRTRNQDLVQYLQQRTSVELQDTNFDTYASFGDVFFYAYQDACRDGGPPIEKMNQVAADFNRVIKQIFESYELASEWDNTKGAPRLRLNKSQTEIGVESLSLGEQEILSLVLNIYTARNSHDVILVDEPEIHLNWHLEERLFNFLDWFCQQHKKQVIVATHSRVVFTGRFLPKTWFLFWEGNRIKAGREIPSEQRRRIAGEAVSVFKLGDFAKPFFFVEDETHEQILQAIADVLGSQVIISQCGNSSNVESLFRLSTREEGWQNCYFLRDGDNQLSRFSNSQRFIQLDRYCIENYLFDFDASARVTNRTPEQIKQAIVEAIKENKQAIVKGGKFLGRLLDQLDAAQVTGEDIDTLDASLLIPSFLRRMGIERAQYVQRYVQELQATGKIGVVFPKKLIQAIKGQSEDAS